MQTIYLDLTEEFNRGHFRAIICSGQAVVLHQLAVMSKDGDWILREQQSALDHILQVLSARGAKYRFGAPTDQLLYSRSARDLIRLAEAHPQIIKGLITRRPLLGNIDEGTEELARALDEERRELIRKNETHLEELESDAQNDSS